MQDIQNFWSLQFAEHAFFIQDGIDVTKDPSLKQEAINQYTKWQQYLTNPTEDFNALMSELLNLKQKILNIISSGGNIGSIYPAELEHMIMELKFVQKQLNSNVSEQEEIDFWIQENSQHTGAAAHYLDPLEKNLTDKNLEMSDLIENTSDDQVMDIIEESNKSALNLNKLVKSNKVLTINNPVTSMKLEHEIREAQLGQQRLSMLLSM